MKHPIIWLSPFLVIVFLLSSCQSKYERFQTEAAKADRVTIYFYEDVESKKDYKGLKITAGKPQRIEEIVGFVTDSVHSESSCSPVGHMVFRDQNGAAVFDLPFCFAEEAAYLAFDSNEFRLLSARGTEFLRKHFRTYEAITAINAN